MIVFPIICLLYDVSFRLDVVHSLFEDLLMHKAGEDLRISTLLPTDGYLNRLKQIATLLQVERVLIDLAQAGGDRSHFGCTESLGNIRRGTLDLLGNPLTRQARTAVISLSTCHIAIPGLFLYPLYYSYQ